MIGRVGVAGHLASQVTVLLACSHVDLQFLGCFFTDFLALGRADGAGVDTTKHAPASPLTSLPTALSGYYGVCTRTRSTIERGSKKILSIYEHHELSSGVARDGDGAAHLGYARFEAPRTRLEMAIVQVNRLTGAGARCSFARARTNHCRQRRWIKRPVTEAGAKKLPTVLPKGTFLEAANMAEV